MAALTFPKVEEWLDANPENTQDYFLRKADMILVNKWLVAHGFQTIQEYLSGRRGSLSQDSSTPNSPVELKCGDGFFSETRHHRSNSKKHLRQDFAKSKMRNMFRTYELPASSDTSTEARRSSLKEMRQYKSLPPTSINMLSMLIQSRVRLPRYPSKDADMKRELRHINERDFFLEIVKDISNDLDIKSLSTKIVANVGLLVDADNGSLFFVENKAGKQILVSKLFDVHTGANILPASEVEWTTQVPWGKGIIGHVAETGDTVNLRHAGQDPRYSNDVDRITGYKTDSLLCMPIRDADDEIIGVSQVINKNGGEGFTVDDEKMLATYLTFCGIAIHNAHIFEAYTREYERNKALLEVVHDLFEEQTSFENVIQMIMQRTQTLLKCERCSVLLRENTSEPSFTKVFDLAYPVRNGHSKLSADNLSDLKLANKIAELVLVTGETINITDAYQDPRFDPETDKLTGFHTRSILCKPIRNNKFQIIGVAQIVNRTDGRPFDDCDDQLFEAFAIFCGLGMTNAMLYEEVLKISAKQSVALEVLSYHASVNGDEVMKTKLQPVPEANHWNLKSLTFNDFSLNRDEMVLAGIRIFQDLGLIRRYKIDYETLCRWMLTVRKNYRNVAYHNWRHAFNVCQVMFAILTQCNMRNHLTEKECLGLAVAALCHDLDHRGTNNAFQQKTSSALAQLYGTKATLEHHHFNHAVMILNSEVKLSSGNQSGAKGNNIFANVSSEEYVEVMNILKQAILATDLSVHLQGRSKFFAMVEEDGVGWEDKERKTVLRDILMTACDVAAITKPWEVQRQVADLVMSEFFDQGDKERNELNIQPQALMDRERQDELPKLQLGWIDGICLPLYKALAKMEPKFQPMLDGVLANRQQWEILDAERLSKQAFIETGV
ncbi:dual 3',5'-cyclic-AMP and -GMP phosphodiesterase 11A-like isoform X2 [Liolophura sinensis]|uniref:dual 3',5'-cyclic-AMP and -GMP phosphodiesterase 11A-like isoform X2 n=1 Tax=Liolophura sinensis TaxID=3198878 RepID=UPI00315803E6